MIVVFHYCESSMDFLHMKIEINRDENDKVRKKGILFLLFELRSNHKFVGHHKFDPTPGTGNWSGGRHRDRDWGERRCPSPAKGVGGTLPIWITHNANLFVGQLMKYHLSENWHRYVLDDLSRLFGLVWAIHFSQFLIQLFYLKYIVFVLFFSLFM